MNWYFMALKNYANFKGRSRRREYWTFVALNIVIAVILGLVGGTDANGNSWLTTIFWLAMLIPSLAVGARRMHDAGHSGWWIIVPIVNLVFALTDSKPDNEWGPNPKAA